VKLLVSCLTAQVLVDNGVTLSFIRERFAQKLPLTNFLKEFMIALKMLYKRKVFWIFLFQIG